MNNRLSLTHPLLLTWAAASAFASCSASAQEVGQVTARTPVYQQVAVPRQNCQSTPVTVPNASSGAGALMGAIAGATVGSQIGGGNGRALATMAGFIGGAALGDRIENPGSTLQSQTVCSTQHVYENRLVGFNVSYDYAGKSYTVQWPYDPGPTIALQVTPVAAMPPQGAETAPVAVGPAMPLPTPTALPMPPVETRVVYVPTPVYRAYPPLQTHIQLGWGWGSGGHRHGHRHGPHWR